MKKATLTRETPTQLTLSRDLQPQPRVFKTDAGENPNAMNTWRSMISEEMTEQNDAWTEIVGCTLSQEQLDAEHPDHLYKPDGVPFPPFTLWTKTRVYFDVENCERHECRSVPRHPCNEATLLSFD